MTEAKKPLQIFFAGLAIVVLVEFVRAGLGTLHAQGYAVGVVVIACSVFTGAVELVGNHRLHTPTGVLASVAGLLFGSIVTFSLAARFLSML